MRRICRGLIRFNTCKSKTIILKVTVYEKSIFNCGIDRAFKAPILGDATRFLNGYLCQPPIIGFENDENWGLLDGIRYPIIQGNFFIKAHRIFKDKIIEKNNNRFWKWELTNFTSPYLFFAYRAIGSWSVQKLSHRKISILYSYSYFSKNLLCHPINWLFVKIQLKGMMNKALIGIKTQAESNKDFYYST